jgi:hypothetical protein
MIDHSTISIIVIYIPNMFIVWAMVFNYKYHNVYSTGHSIVRILEFPNNIR